MSSRDRQTPVWLLVVAVFFIGGPVYIGLGFGHYALTGHGAGLLMGWFYIIIVLLAIALGWLALRWLWRRVVRGATAQ